MSNLALMKTRFEEEVHKIRLKKSRKSHLFTKAEYVSFLNQVKASKTKVTSKTQQEYQRLRWYDVVEIDNVQRLVVPTNKTNGRLVLFTYIEEVFDIIHATHISMQHAKRNKMMQKLKKEYRNITGKIVITYLNLCKKCQQNNSGQSKSIKSALMSRCQVDIIDMQSQADGDYKFILIYRDFVTKFVQLKALKSESPEEVANHLLDIFTIFGAPCIMHSGNKGLEFVHKVTEELSQKWIELKVLIAKPLKGFVDGSEPKIKNMVITWLKDNNTTKWAEGLKFVQLMKNRLFHLSLKRSAYEAMFSHKATVGLKTFLPEDTSDMKTEEDLKKSLESESSSDEEYYSDTDKYLEIVEHPVKIEPGTSNSIEEYNEVLIKEELMDEDSLEGTLSACSEEGVLEDADTDPLEKQEIHETRVLKRSNSSPVLEDEFVPIKLERFD